MKGPFFTLNNGVEMPALGFGVYQSGDDTRRAVEQAIDYGYGMIDTAAAYFNEELVGNAVRSASVPREQLFIQSKLWISDFGYDSALYGFERSMKKLGLETLDSYLLHWPLPDVFDKTIESWKALTRLYEEGRIRSIGMCNANAEELKRLSDATGVMPSVNQIELHPYLAQPELQKGCQDLGVVVQAWSPIGGVIRYGGNVDDTSTIDPLQNETIQSLADKYGKTPAQVMLNWHLAKGVSAIPKSVTEKRIHENADITDFTLTQADLVAVDALDRNLRGGPNPKYVNFDTLGLKIED